MKKIFVILAFLIGGINAYGATRADPRAGTPTAQASSTAQSSARVARTPVAARGTTTATAQRVSSRSAMTTPAANTSNVASRGRSAVASPNVARAGKQSVISTGTKVATANQNTVVDEACWNKFSGCMDSFCMLDNANGGRCICSDKNSEYDSILAEIQKLDEQSYQMATVGVERIEMGEDADAVIAKTKEITGSIEKENTTQSKRKSLDLSAWNIADFDMDEDVEDIFSLSSDGTGVANKTGDALYRASAKLCNAQLPECKDQSKMMELMYQQRVRSDCSAYENSLKQQRTQSAQKLAAAQSAMREAALEQYRNANKYDLGQCTVQFKQCMQTTGGCGEDFTGCVTQQTTRDTLLSTTGTKAPKQTKIKGALTTIEIAAWTYDTLEAKKPLCMGVTQQCVNVRDQVWDTFLREVAPQLKSAELAAESNMRTSCISEISNCFQKACKDNIDPNDPDGSYDMCLTNPGTLGDVCKIQIAPCEAAIPNLMTYVHNRLASMRVDSCTREFKSCLQSEDRCGQDYTQCVGLDTDSIVDLCPVDKLPGCKYSSPSGNNDEPQIDVRNNLADIAQGIFLNIDNMLLAKCQKAVQTKVLEICGSLSDCDAFEDDDVMGTDSLIMYRSKDQIIIDGLMNFGLLKGITKETETTQTTVTEDGATITKKNITTQYNIDDDDYDYDGMENETENRIRSAIQTVGNRVQQKIDALNTDPTIDMCINGRSGSWRYSQSTGTGGDSAQRFPHLLDSYATMIFNSGLNKAYLNYNAKYNELVGKAMEEQSDDIKSALCAAISYQQGSLYCTAGGEAEDGTTACSEWGARGEMSNIFNEPSDTTGDTGLVNNGSRYVLQVADLGLKLKTMSSGKGEFIQTDGDGNMIGSISMTSSYSPGTNTCTITTTSMLCSEMEEIMDKTTENCNTGGGVVGISAACNGLDITVLGAGHSKTVTKEEFKGALCSKYGEPVISETPIKM